MQFLLIEVGTRYDLHQNAVYAGVYIDKAEGWAFCIDYEV